MVPLLAQAPALLQAAQLLAQAPVLLRHRRRHCLAHRPWRLVLVPVHRWLLAMGPQLRLHSDAGPLPAACRSGCLALHSCCMASREMGVAAAKHACRCWCHSRHGGAPPKQLCVPLNWCLPPLPLLLPRQAMLAAGTAA